MSGLDPRLLENRMPDLEAHVAALAEPARGRLRSEILAFLASPDATLLQRISAGNALGLLGDPRLDPLRPQMCAVPAGTGPMGTPVEDVEAVCRRFALPPEWMLKSTPRHEVTLDAFEIARFPVTEGEYAAFLADTELWETPTHWVDGRPPRWRSNHPVHGVGWQGALWYAQWVSERTGLQFRVPTEAEWERAARGRDGRAWPWGDEFDPARCNTREGGVGSTTPVGCYPEGASPCGALDLAGNVEEFTADLYWLYPGCAWSDPDEGSYRMTRGGVWSLDGDLARCDRRHGTPFAGPTGFRLARSAADGWLEQPAPPSSAAAD